MNSKEEIEENFVEATNIIGKLTTHSLIIDANHPATLKLLEVLQQLQAFRKSQITIKINSPDSYDSSNSCDSSTCSNYLWSDNPMLPSSPILQSSSDLPVSVVAHTSHTSFHDTSSTSHNKHYKTTHNTQQKDKYMHPFEISKSKEFKKLSQKNLLGVDITLIENIKVLCTVDNDAIEISCIKKQFRQCIVGADNKFYEEINKKIIPFLVKGHHQRWYEVPNLSAIYTIKK